MVLYHIAQIKGVQASGEGGPATVQYLPTVIGTSGIAGENTVYINGYQDTVFILKTETKRRKVPFGVTACNHLYRNIKKSFHGAPPIYTNVCSKLL